MPGAVVGDRFVRRTAPAHLRSVVGSALGLRMATPEVLDFAKLLAPIPGDHPSGTDLRADPSAVSDLRTTRTARDTASTAERQQIEKGDDAIAPDWRPVLERGSKALAEKTKDLDITAWLIEALVRLRGFAGLRDGFRLA